MVFKYAVGKLTANRRKEGIHDRTTEALSQGSHDFTAPSSVKAVDWARVQVQAQSVV